MSETAATGDGAGASGSPGAAATVAAATDAGAGAPTQPAASAPAPAPSDDVFAELPESEPLFNRGYVDKIRREGARYRDEARTAQETLSVYDDVYSMYEEADRDVWLDLARQWAVDPRQAATAMQQIAAAVLGEGGEMNDPAAPVVTDPSAAGATASNGPITNEQIAELVRNEVERRDAERAQQQMVESIYSTMRASGIEPKSREGMAVLWTANNETNGDIDKAIELYQADRQKAVDEYIATRQSGGRPAPAPNGVPASQHTPIKNLDDARRAADEFIRSQANAS